jgi:hypothetical protein
VLTVALRVNKLMMRDARGRRYKNYTSQKKRIIRGFAHRAAIMSIIHFGFIVVRFKK